MPEPPTAEHSMPDSMADPPTEAPTHAVGGTNFDLPLGDPADEHTPFTGMFPSSTPVPQEKVSSPDPATEEASSDDSLSLLANRYRLVREIGRGGFGVVWLAHDTRLDNRKVAIKLLEPRILNDPRATDSLRREAAITIELTHPRIVRLHIFDVDGPMSFLVFEYLAGPTLSDVFRSRRKLTIPETALVVEQVCSALNHAHQQGVIHCDIKPSNIMAVDPIANLQSDPLTAQTFRLKLTDFGISQTLREAMESSAQGNVVGTPTYMAPEQLRGRHATAASDIYSLGCVLYQLLAGAPPFHGGDIVQKHLNEMPLPIPGAPQAVDAVIQRCLAKAPESRWESPAALAQAFRVAVDLAESQTPEEEGSGSLRIVAKPAAAEIISAPDEYIGPSDMPFRLIPGGTFRMGSEEGEEGHRPDESPIHEVTLDAFYMGKFPVTVGEYAEFLHRTRHRKPHRWTDQREHPRRPVVYVSWNDAATFCEWMSRVGRRRFRLPTEAEWERAARGGMERRLYPWGDEPPDGRAVWDPGDKRDGSNWQEVTQHLRDVGHSYVNAYDLCDMAGLVAEWCHDHYSEAQYIVTPAHNPRGPDTGAHRVLRGGSWRLQMISLRCAARFAVGPGSRCPDFGFRVVCEITSGE